MPTVEFQIAVATDDGIVTGSDASYPPTADSASTDEIYASGQTVRSFAGGEYPVYVNMFRWDTSSIPDDAIVVAASLSIYITSTSNADSRDFAVEWYDWGAAIGVEDYSATASNTAHSGTSISSLSTSQYNTFALGSLENISKTGYTYLRTHITGGQPTGSNQVVCFNRNSVSSSNLAKLSVTYLLPPFYKRLYGPAQLTASAADLYTCPASTVARVLSTHVSNPSGAAVDVNLSIGADAAATRIWDDHPIPADKVETNFDPYELAAGEKIQGWADSAGTIVLTISGYEDPV